jgi:uncharacterized membrane protein
MSEHESKTHAPVDAKSGTGNSNICAILSYILIGVIWYFVDKELQKDSFVKFHVKQGLVLLAFAILYSIVLNILIVVSFGLLAILALPLSLVPWILVALGMYNAYSKKETGLPVIGKFAERLNF